jgi:hypothetical protein
MAGHSDAGDIRGGVRGEIGAFLSTRRARISPAQAGLPVYPGRAPAGPGLAPRGGRRPRESFPIPAEPSQSLLTYTTEPGSPSHDALSLLASWATSPAHDSQASPQYGSSSGS